MTAADILAALDLPDNSRVDRRVPKTLLLENRAPTAADKRRESQLITIALEQTATVSFLASGEVGCGSGAVGEPRGG